MPQNTELAARLLRDAASFFSRLAERNYSSRDAHEQNTRAFERVARLLEQDPQGRDSTDDDGRSHVELAAALLRDAAKFFRLVGAQNAPLTEQMNHNADAYQNIAELLENNPSGRVDNKPTVTLSSLAAGAMSPLVTSRYRHPSAPDDPPLQFGLSYPTLPHRRFWRRVGTGTNLNGFRQGILRRDLDACAYCGHHSRKYQEIVAEDGAAWDLSRVRAVCIFCAQCLMLDSVSKHRSGVLIFAPEISQTDLNALARVIYVCRISQGPAAEKARLLLDRLMKRRKPGTALLRSDDPARLAAALGDCRTPEDCAALDRRFADIRPFPLDRRIVWEADLEFNQFPQILAYWRSKDGPFAGMSPPRMDTGPFDRILGTWLQA